MVKKRVTPSIPLITCSLGAGVSPNSSQLKPSSADTMVITEPASMADRDSGVSSLPPGGTPSFCDSQDSTAAASMVNAISPMIR